MLSQVGKLATLRGTLPVVSASNTLDFSILPSILVTHLSPILSWRETALEDHRGSVGIVVPQLIHIQPRPLFLPSGAKQWRTLRPYIIESTT